MVEGPRGIEGASPPSIAAGPIGSQKIAKVASPGLTHVEGQASASLAPNRVQSPSTMLGAVIQGLLTLVQGLANLIRYGRTYSEERARQQILDQLGNLCDRVIRCDHPIDGERMRAFTQINEIVRELGRLFYTPEQQRDLLLLRSHLPGLDKAFQRLNNDLVAKEIALRVLPKEPPRDEMRVDTLSAPVASPSEVKEEVWAMNPEELTRIANRVISLAQQDIGNATFGSAMTSEAKKLRKAVTQLEALLPAIESNITEVRMLITKVGKLLIYPVSKESYRREISPSLR